MMMKRPKKIMAHLRECSTIYISGKKKISLQHVQRKGMIWTSISTLTSHMNHGYLQLESPSKRNKNIKDGQRNSPPKSPKNFVLPHFNSFENTKTPNWLHRVLPKNHRLRHMSDGKNAETECTRTRKPSSVEKLWWCHSVLGFDILLLRFKTWSQWRKVTR